MIYLSKFKVLNDEQESDLKVKKYDKFISIYDLYAKDEYYPAGILSSKELNSLILMILLFYMAEMAQEKQPC